MVNSSRNCILSNRYALNLFISLAFIIIYFHFSGSGLVAAFKKPDKSSNKSPTENFHEDLYIRPLNDGKLLAHFQFLTTYRDEFKNLRWKKKIDILPLSIVDLVTSIGMTELHFSLTKGNWNYKNWGYPARSNPPGAQIRASFTRHSNNLDEAWRRLTNSLAGLFCASLISANEETLVMPKLAFNDPTFSKISNDFDDRISHSSNETSKAKHILYTHLPDETLCTGNLTPWKGLLPYCSESSLASLLNAINLFKSSYSSLVVDLESSKCLDSYGDVAEGCEIVQLKQSISVVFNPLQQFEGKQTWSLAKTFGSSIKEICAVAQHSFAYVDITDLDDKTKLYPQNTYEEHSINLGAPRREAIQRKYATFNLRSLVNESAPNRPFNLGIKQNQLFKKPSFSSRKTIPVYLRSHIAGLGSYDGTIVATVQNSLDEPVRITYMDIVPYFMRIYLHTLHIRLTNSGQELKPDRLNFALSQDRTPTLIELSLVLPPQSETQISYDFERAFLKWTDYKPDAHKGVLLSSSMIAFSSRYVPVMEQLVIPLSLAQTKLSDTAITPSLSGNTTTQNARVTKIEAADQVVRIYARPLLVILPTPDFSMPYNVLCLVSTVLVFAFGPIYNLTIRRPVVRRKRKDVQAKEDCAPKKDE